MKVNDRCQHREGCMKKKKLMPAVMAVLLIAVAVLVIITQSPYWSRKSFEAVVQEIIVQSDGEVRLIVERTTEIYSNPLNSLHISEETELVGMDGDEMQIENLQPGDTVEVVLKDSFVEETPFYYPTVYKIRVFNN